MEISKSNHVSQDRLKSASRSMLEKLYKLQKVNELFQNLREPENIRRENLWAKKSFFLTENIRKSRGSIFVK